MAEGPYGKLASPKFFYTGLCNLLDWSAGMLHMGIVASNLTRSEQSVGGFSVSKGGNRAAITGMAAEGLKPNAPALESIRAAAQHSTTFHLLLSADLQCASVICEMLPDPIRPRR